MAPAPSFTVCFRGVRGSFPVSRKEMIRYGVATTCNEVFAGNHHLILDAGTGLTTVGDEMIEAWKTKKTPLEATLLFTHTHHDHLQGFPYFKPVYYRNANLNILGPRQSGMSMREAIETILIPPYHPVSLKEMSMKVSFTDLEGGEIFKLGPKDKKPRKIKSMRSVTPTDVVIKTCYNRNHPKLGVLHYRIEYGGKAFVFATDVEGFEDGEETLIEFSRDADLLAHDAMYTNRDYYHGDPPKRGWGHSTCSMACATAREAGVKSLALIHHDYENADTVVRQMEKEAKKEFSGAFAAKEGQVVKLL